MESLVELLDIEVGKASKDLLVSSIANDAYKKMSKYVLDDYEDEDGYEAYPDFDYTEDI